MAGPMQMYLHDASLRGALAEEAFSDVSDMLASAGPTEWSETATGMSELDGTT